MQDQNPKIFATSSFKNDSNTDRDQQQLIDMFQFLLFNLFSSIKPLSKANANSQTYRPVVSNYVETCIQLMKRMLHNLLTIFYIYNNGMSRYPVVNIIIGISQNKNTQFDSRIAVVTQVLQTDSTINLILDETKTYPTSQPALITCHFHLKMSKLTFF